MDLDLTAKTDKTLTRTQAQNKSMWLWFKLVAEYLNKQGDSFEYTVLKTVKVPFTDEVVHKYIWKPVLKAWLDKNSTTDMDTSEPNEIYTIICAHFATERGYTLPAWPSRFYDSKGE